MTQSRQFGCPHEGVFYHSLLFTTLKKRKIELPKQRSHTAEANFKNRDFQCTDNLGMTALHMAATHGYVEIVKLLIERGADLHACDNDLMTPLHFACAEGNTDIVQMILERGQEEGGILVVK